MSQIKQVAIFGLMWPKLSFSAASVRTTGLIHSLIKQGCQIHYICPQKIPKNEEEFELGMYNDVKIHHVQSIEDFEGIQRIFQKISGGIDATIFDTFIAEEKFSHFIHRFYPDCLKILDLQDLHSLRIQRKDMVLGQEKNTNKTLDYEKEDLQDLGVIGHENMLQQDIYGRELASIMRSDMVITCSDYEKFYLEKKYKLKNIELMTFFYPFSDLKLKNMKKQYENRKHFVWIGNHSHAPNLDSLNILLQQVWPKIVKKLPEAQLHVYGSNFNKQISDSTHIPNFRPLGLLKDLSRLQNYRAMLAPIRFGGGIKGKITDSWQNYLPVVTTPMGAEGLFKESSQESSIYTEINTKATFNKDKISQNPTENNIKNTQNVLNYYQSYNNENQQQQNEQKQQELLNNLQKLSFGGICTNLNSDQFAESAIDLYNNENNVWNQSVQNGIDTNLNRMSFLRNDLIFQIKLGQYHSNLQQSRQSNPFYSITWSETLKSTENFAKYINQKRKNKVPKFKK